MHVMCPWLTAIPRSLEISDTAISLVSRSVPPEDGDRLLRLMQPFSIALAVRDACRIFLRRKLERLRRSTPTSWETSPSEAMSVSDNAMNTQQVDLDVLEQITQSAPRKPPSIRPQANIPEDRKGNQSFFISSLQGLLPELGPGSDLHEASVAFKKRLKDSWSKSPHTPRRGSFFTSGPVGLRGAKGFCRVEVVGEYDPAARRWSAVYMRLRDGNVFKQRPLGPGS